MSASSITRALEHPSPNDTRFDRRLAQILDFATEVFAEKGYDGASMRDLSRLSGISLAGLYYYFESKEKLLYFIQQHTFATIVERLRERLASSSDPEARIRIFIHNHVEYSVARQKAMKVLSHEDDVLANGYGVELATIKREYYRICVGLVDDLAKAEGLKSVGVTAGATHGIGTRTAVMGLFGMMNWLYTWYKPRVDPDAKVLAREISDIFLQGIRGGTKAGRGGHGAAEPKRSKQKTPSRKGPATKRRT
jgi:AcrR family transcriptional regulator